MALQFKFVELSIVTDETIEETVNGWVVEGWQFEGIRFVTTEHSKRPSMAFVSFTRHVVQRIADEEAPRTPRPLVRLEDERESERPPGGSPVHDQPPAIVKDDEDSPAVIVAAHGDDVE